MNIEDYKNELIKRELTPQSIRKYLRDIDQFLDFIGNRDITKELLIEYQEELLKTLKVTTVNTKITIINNFLDFIGKDIEVSPKRVQKSNHLDNVMTKNDFDRVVRMARTKGNERARITMLSLYHTGVRVSELEFLTVEAINNGYIDIDNKGKIRRVPIVPKLKKELNQYIKNEGIESGPIILNNRRKPLSRSGIFKELKYIGGQARVRKDKIYPHSFRHLFAKQYLEHNKGEGALVTLADILGHSSLDTTRVYLTKTTEEQRETMNF